MAELTVVYYSSNRENDSFEKRILQQLNASIGDADVDLISVTQIPIDCGKNICVGPKDACDANALRQLSIGIAEAKTKYVAAAEADSIYPSEYFRFLPDSVSTLYRFSNVWVFYIQRDYYFFKGFQECAQICGRDHWLKKINQALKDYPEWCAGVQPPYVFDAKCKIGVFSSENPVVSFKTRMGLRTVTKTTRIKSYALPKWGPAMELKNRFIPDWHRYGPEKH